MRAHGKEAPEVVQRTSTMIRHALTMMVGTLASRVLGLAREIFTAALFGASGLLDAFNVAFTLANLARQLLAEGALSASFVPVFSRVLAAKGKEAAARLARQTLFVLLLATSAVVAAGMVLSPWLVAIMAPGVDMAKAGLAVAMTRFMFPFLLFVSLAALAMGVLNSMGSFFIPALAPALSNVVYIIIIVLFSSKYGAWGLVAAVLAGGAAQFLLQWLWSAHLGVPLVPDQPDRGDPDLRVMLRLFLPYAAGLSLNQVNPVISRMFASFLQEGAISVLNYANRVIQLPLGLFVIAVSQAVLPQLARCPLDMKEEFRDLMRDALRFALFVVLPVTAVMVLLSSEIVHLLFFRGAFNRWAWEGTAYSLAMYSLGLPGMACSTVVMRGLYARSMPRAALYVTLSSVIGTALFSFLLMKPLSYGGLALGTSLAFTASGLYGIHLLSRSLGTTLGVFSPAWMSKMGSALLGVSGLTVAAKTFLPYAPEAPLIVRVFWTGGILLFVACAYAATTALLRFPEWRWLKDACVRKVGGKRETGKDDRS